MASAFTYTCIQIRRVFCNNLHVTVDYPCITLEIINAHSGKSQCSTFGKGHSCSVSIESTWVSDGPLNPFRLNRVD